MTSRPQTGNPSFAPGFLWHGAPLSENPSGQGDTAQSEKAESGSFDKIQCWYAYPLYMICGNSRNTKIIFDHQFCELLTIDKNDFTM